MPESPLYLYHQEMGCLICASLGSRVHRRGWSSLLRLPVKFGQVTITCRRPRPPQRTGSWEQEVIVNDVRRCKERENESLCLRKSTSDDFCSPKKIIFVWNKYFYFIFLIGNMKLSTTCALLGLLFLAVFDSAGGIFISFSRKLAH